MKAFLTLLAFVGAASADLSAVADSIIQETRSSIKYQLEFPPLSYEKGNWDQGFTKYDVSGKLSTSAGKLFIGEFTRQEAPILWGSSKDGMLETRFFVQTSTVKYDQFSALNYTSGDKSEGQLSVFFEETEMYSLIKIKSEGSSCTSSVSTLTPISMGAATAKFVPNSKLTESLWDGAKDYLNYPLNSTIVHAALPEFAKVVAKTDLCSLLS